MQQTDFRTGEIRPIECFKEGWEAIKPQYWLIFAISMLGAIIGGISFYVLMGAMACGMFICYFRAIDGETVEVEHLFRGFHYFWPSLLVTILFVGPVIILFVLIYVPLLVTTFMGARMGQDELFNFFIGTLALEFVFAVAMVCLHTLLLFSYPLIVDRGLSGWSAVTTSARAVLKNLKGVAGLWAAGFVAMILGYLAFCVGLYFVIPLVVAANVTAYRKVFPRLPGKEEGPPPPERYESLAKERQD